MGPSRYEKFILELLTKKPAKLREILAEADRQLLNERCVRHALHDLEHLGYISLGWNRKYRISREGLSKPSPKNDIFDQYHKGAIKAEIGPTGFYLYNRTILSDSMSIEDAKELAHWILKTCDEAGY
jgi:hypothetical protein